MQSGKLRRTLDLSPQFVTQVWLYLPAALMSVEIRLPERSQPGVYRVAVFVGGNGGDCVAQAECKSTQAKARAVVRAHLDLRNAMPGIYVLSTQCEGQSSPQMYPLEIGPREAQ
jgi:hypothetical protein